LLALPLGLIVAEWLLYRAIRRQAVRDEARSAAAIVVFGAAEYNGVPSPVFKARLDHTFDLEERGLAGTVITTGGSGGDPHFTEAGVGRDYLIQQGMAEGKIVPETRSQTTWESIQAVTRLLEAHHAHTCVAVSDGFHLYRIKLMFAAQGVTAYGSPSPDSPIESEPYLRTLHSLREMLVTSFWYLGYRG
jgi:uncharacterized SAM-binding protein YcdF (DUF218 family)